PFSAGGKQYGAGSFIIRGAQPWEPYVRDLLTPQVYPDMRLYPGGPPKRPYDITGWTLNYQMGVAVDRVKERVDVATEKIDTAPVPPIPTPSGQGAFAIDPRENDAFIVVNRLLKAGATVSRATAPIPIGSLSHVREDSWPAGAFLVAPGAGAAGLPQAARSLGVTYAAISQMPASAI